MTAVASAGAVGPPGPLPAPVAPLRGPSDACGRSCWRWGQAPGEWIGKSPATVWQRAGRSAVVAAILLCATGCWATNPAATTMDYSPADGIQEELGEVELHNVVIVATAADQQGRVLGTLVNNGAQEVTLGVDADGATAGVRIPAQGLVQLENTTPVLLERAGADPGLMVDTEFTAANESLITAVPVFDATLDYYAPFLPNTAPSATRTDPPTRPDGISPQEGEQ